MNLSIQRPRPRSRSVVVTAGTLLAAAVWLSVIAIGDGVEPTTGNVHDNGYLTQERAAAPIASDSAPALVAGDSLLDEPAYFESKTHDCGVAASGGEGGFMSHWARPSTI